VLPVTNRRSTLLVHRPRRRRESVKFPTPNVRSCGYSGSLTDSERHPHAARRGSGWVVLVPVERPSICGITKYGASRSSVSSSAVLSARRSALACPAHGYTNLGRVGAGWHSPCSGRSQPRCLPALSSTICRGHKRELRGRSPGRPGRAHLRATGAPRVTDICRLTTLSYTNAPREGFRRALYVAPKYKPGHGRAFGSLRWQRLQQTQTADGCFVAS